MYLLDTNIISEIIKREPNKFVLEWLKKINMQKFFLSVITIGEIRKGIEKLSNESQKQQIQKWLENDLLNQFSGRIINIDTSIADKWGYLTATNTIPAIDAFLAASALVYNCKLVTRNVKDFKEITGLEIIHPWIK